MSISGQGMSTTQANLETDLRGHYGPYGGRFVPEALMSALVNKMQHFAPGSLIPSSLAG